MSKEIVYDFKSICRSCLQTNIDLNVIFSNGFNELLLACTDIKIFLNDGLPDHICNLCVIQLKNAFEFKKKCESNDVTLREYAIQHKIVIARDVGAATPGSQLSSIKEESDDFMPTIKPEITFVETPEFYNNLKNIKNETIVDENFDEINKNDDSVELLSQDDVLDDDDDEEEEEDDDDDDDYDAEDDDDFFENVKKPANNTSSKRSKKEDIIYKLSKDGKYICEVCNRKLVDKKGLKLHMRLHTGFNLKVCNICNRGFAKNNHLKRHMASHNRDINCKYCSDHFTSYAEYRKHLEIHNKKDIRKQRKKSTPNDSTSTLAAIRNSTIDEMQQSTSNDNSLYNINDKIQADCKICDQSFTKICDLRQHIKESHLEESSYTDIDFQSKSYLFDEKNQSLATENSEKISDYLINQIKAGHVMRFYQIIGKNCNEKDLSDSETDTDEENEDENDDEDILMADGTKDSALKTKNQHECSKCNKVFDRYYKILKHLEEEHQNDSHFLQYKCNKCKKFYPNNDLFQRHLRNQCDNTIKSYECDICHLKFMWETSLTKHNDVYHNQSQGTDEENEDSTKPKGKNRCNICNKTFQRMEHLERHRRIHNPSEKKFECPVCQKKFNRKDNLRSHQRIHNAEREELDKHLCVYCGRSFSNSSNLIVHMRRHTGEKPYKCDICDKGFPRSSDLQCHRRTHTGEKPCLCTICGKGFSRSNKLVRHMRIHTGIRPYECTYCDRSFTQSNDLTLHIRRHTGEKPYVCGVCGDRFIQGTALKQHQKLTGHVEDPSKPSPFASISVNNPSRFTNANRVNRIGTTDSSKSNILVQPTKKTNSKGAAASSETIATTSSTSSPSTPTAEYTTISAPTQSRMIPNIITPAGYITANGGFLPNNGVLMQNVELSTFLSLSNSYQAQQNLTKF